MRKASLNFMLPELRTLLTINTEARYVKELFEYCREKPDIKICTYRDFYNWIDHDPSDCFRNA